MPEGRDTSSHEPSISEKKFEELKRTYTRAYRRRLSIDRILVSETSPDLDRHSFSSEFPVFGPIRNRGGSVYFDDGPHVSQFAERHADAFQLGPLYGNVEGYTGDVLFGSDIPIQNEGNPLPSDDPSALAQLILEEVPPPESTSDGALLVVGQSTALARLKHGGAIDATGPVQELRRMQPGIRPILVPGAPRNRLYALPLSRNVAVLKTDPGIGEVRFGEPVKHPDRFTIRAKSMNRLELRDVSRIWGFAVQDAGGVSDGG